ncbi:hypothetical protein RV05_GL000806 [Enterococcus hirae]|nr:hypothetical protein RV05_GL000806 [Enterococcus hirae]
MKKKTTLFAVEWFLCFIDKNSIASHNYHIKKNVKNQIAYIKGFSTHK